MKKQSYTLKRDSLDTELENILRYPATFIVAPMGYGKSTAAFSYLEKITTQWVMLSFDSAVAAAAHIWNLLAAQLEKGIPQLGKQLYNLGYPMDYTQFVSVVEVFEEYCRENELIFIIDDFHNVQSPEFIDIVQQMVMSRIKGLHFLIISRKIPDVRLEELILKNYCYLIDSIAFEVNQQQISDYFNLYGVQLTVEECEKIYKISEGWISAVCLLQRRYMQTGQITMENGIENMLATSSQFLYSDTELMVLKKLALLDNFTLPLAIYLIDDPQIEHILKRMCYHNLFIRFDTHDNTYRMHNILSNFLKKSLNRTRSTLDAVDVYSKTGKWYIENGDTIQGMIYLLRAGDFKDVLNEFEKTEMTEFYDRIPCVIVDLFNKIPMEERYKNPIAYLSYIGFYITNIDVAPGYDMLADANTYYNETVKDKEKLNRINGEIELIRTYINFNDLNHMRANLSKAQSLLKGKSLIANPKKIPTFGSPNILYLYYRSDMRIFDTVDQMDITYPYYYALSGGCGDGFIHQMHGEAHLEIGDFENAERYAKKAIYSIHGTGQLAVSMCSYFTLARCYIAQGDIEKGLTILEQQRDAIWNSSPPMLINCYELISAYIDCILNKQEDLPKWITSGDLSESEILYQGMGFSYIVYGKYLVMKKNYLRLEVLCERMQKAFSQFKNEIGFLHMYILEAIAKSNLYGKSSATDTLEKALVIGSANNITLLFAEYGEVMFSLLTDYVETGVPYTKYLETVIEMSKDYVKITRNIMPNNTTNLTEREIATLNLVCSGRTNREISEELFIAEITVRKNLTSIYRKLNVTNRASAIRKILDENAG